MKSANSYLSNLMSFASSFNVVEVGYEFCLLIGSLFPSFKFEANQYPDFTDSDDYDA